MDCQQLLMSLMPNAHQCRANAESLLVAFPRASPELLAEKAVSQVKTFLAAKGAAGGVVANRLAMVPLGFAEMGIVLNREAKLAGVVPALLEPDVLKDEYAFNADILAILFPGAVSQALPEVAVRAGLVTTRTLIRKYISKDVLKTVIRFAAKNLGIKLTQRAIITKAVPLVGAGIGATWNWIEVQALRGRGDPLLLGPVPGGASRGTGPQKTLGVGRKLSCIIATRMDQ